VNPRGIVTQQDADRITAARNQKTAADANWRQVVLDVAARSSVRAAAKVAGISPDTITQWKKQAN
jgi:transposase